MAGQLCMVGMVAWMVQYQRGVCLTLCRLDSQSTSRLSLEHALDACEECIHFVVLIRRRDEECAGDIVFSLGLELPYYLEVLQVEFYDTNPNMVP